MTAKATVRAVLAATAILGFGVAGLSMADKRPEKVSAPKPSPPQRVALRLLGPASGITGADVPARVFTAERGAEYFQIDGPSVVTVSLPGGKVISLLVNRVLVTAEVDVKAKSAVVVDIRLMPLPKSVPLREAVAELRPLMRAMGIEPDEQMRKQLAIWPDDSGPVTYRAGMQISESVGLGAEAKPDDDGGWFLVLTFAAEVKARNVARAAARLATLPTDQRPSGLPRPGERDMHEMRKGVELTGVSIPLLGLTRHVRGMDLEKAAPTMPGYEPELLRPHQLSVRLPESRTLSLTAGGVVLLSDFGVVEGVFARRPLEPVPFREAVADVRRTLEGLGVEPDEAMRRQMAAWPKEEPGMAAGHDIRAAMPLGEQTRLEVLVRLDPRGGWYALLMFDATPRACAATHAIERLATLPTRGTQFSRRPGQEAEDGGGVRPEVSIPLSGPTEQVRGMDMDEHVPGLPLAWPDLSRPCRLTVHLPDGRTPALDVRGVALLSDHGTVTDVFARRPSEPVPFREAVVDLRRALKELGIEPDEAMRRRMADWPVDAPWTIGAVEPPDARSGISLGKTIRLDVRICPDPRGGWYSLLKFGASTNAR